MKARFTRILWAIDPLADNDVLQAPMVEALRAVAGEETVIEPVTVVPADWMGDAQHVAHVEHLLASWLRSTRLSGLQRLTVLPGSLGDLLAHARASKADLIAAATHARMGFERLTAGSFSEALLARSPVPVLFTSPNVKDARDPRRLVFATDFSASCRQAFDRTVEMARRLGASISLFHEAGDPPTLRVAGDRARNWLDFASRRRVTARMRVGWRNKSAGEGVATYARTCGAGMIVMSSTSGPLRSAIVGSTARDTIRRADCPVLVYKL